MQSLSNTPHYYATPIKLWKPVAYKFLDQNRKAPSAYLIFFNTIQLLPGRLGNDRCLITNRGRIYIIIVHYSSR